MFLPDYYGFSLDFILKYSYYSQYLSEFVSELLLFPDTGKYIQQKKLNMFFENIFSSKDYKEKNL
ncbi:hypothetical protein PHEL85_0420 [Polaribacter sp. Hel1_85]|nr:hypothetical protein PHEL85_0420 [Polaribacter sp. Hel1_85]